MATRHVLRRIYPGAPTVPHGWRGTRMPTLCRGSHTAHRRLHRRALPIAPSMSMRFTSTAAAEGQEQKRGPRKPFTQRHHDKGRGLRTVLHTKLSKPFKTIMGDEIPEVVVKWEQWGEPSLPAERTVLVMPSFSHSSHLTANMDDPSAGWWTDMVGPDKFIDTKSFRVLCPAILGASWGTTSPLSVNPTTGEPYGPDFPSLTPNDLARCHKLWLEEIGITGKIHAMIGISLGGMQVLQFASLFPEGAKNMVVIASTAHTSPAANALRYIQRHAVVADSNYNNGRYPRGRGPKAGLAVARELGLLTYQSFGYFNGRFDWGYEPKSDGAPGSDIEGYLKYLGDKFANTFDANCYLLMSKCGDAMALGDGEMSVVEATARIRARSLFVSIDSDFLTPPEQLQWVHDILAREGVPTRHEVLKSKYGHDTAFKDVSTIGPLVQDHLEKGLQYELDSEQFNTSGLSHP